MKTCMRGIHQYEGRRCKECSRIRKKEYDKIQKPLYYLKNKEMLLKKGRDYHKNNRKKINKYQKDKFKNNVNYRLSLNLRNRFRNALKRNSKKGSAVKDLGCSIEELKKHIESKFIDGMSWKNYGSWHIDHIIPLSKFDLTNRDEILKACNYKNLQPLWAIDNIKKGGKS